MPTNLKSSDWLKEGEEKRTAVRSMFASIAPSYDQVNGIMSFSLHQRWREEAVRAIGVRNGEKVLDLCCGTGDFLVALRKAVGPSGSVTGLDFCQPMLDVAHKKLGHEANLSLADASALPLADRQFDAVTVGWGLRNVPDIGLAVREAVRILRPGGRFVTLDMARPRVPILGQIAETIFKVFVPFLGRIIGHTSAYEYLPKSTQVFLNRAQMHALMEQSGLREVQSRDFFLGNICMHWGYKS